MHAAAQFFLDAFYRHRFALLWMGFAISALWHLNALRLRYGAEEDLSYAIADILTNSAGGLTRRALLGDLALVFDRMFGGAPAFWAWAIGVLIWVLLIAASIRVFRALPKDPNLVLLVLAPAGLLFFVYDGAAAFRKETFGLAALAVVLCGAVAKERHAMCVISGLGTALFVLSLLAHEAMIFLWPGFAVAYYLCAAKFPHARVWAGAMAALSLFAALGIVAWVSSLPTPDTAAICAAAKLPKCGGPIAALELSLRGGIAYVFGRRQLEELPVYALYFALAVLPLSCVHPVQKGARRFVILAVCLGVSPLFVVAFDYGRWIAMAAISLTLLACAAVATGQARFDCRWPAWAVILYIGSWALPHAVLRWEILALPIWPALGALLLAERLAPRLFGGR